uniref:Uncharacterized protein n=1 Tax=Rhizophora mucronata TaxID=61149 RepID=A0A2P2NKC9_RHIMU
MLELLHRPQRLVLLGYYQCDYCR